MNERQIIECFRKQQGADHPGLIMGIGDDCAVIEKDERFSWLVTMDTLVEGVHFDLRYHSAEKLGRKAVAVNVSDIAAMGGTPVFVFLSLGLPGRFQPSWADDFSRGIGRACRDFGCFLAGGDTVRSREGVLITITVIGEAPAGEVVFRKGACPGDTVWVSGNLGMAAAGLEILQNDINPGTEELQPLAEAHLVPEPRIRLGRRLAERKIVHAMMDLSDGLATDLSHICGQSGVAAVIDSDRLPLSPLLAKACSLLDLDPIDLMLQGGEDYELLFTAAPDMAGDITALAETAGIPVSPVGSITEGQGVRLRKPSPSTGEVREIDVSYKGYDHFPDT